MPVLLQITSPMTTNPPSERQTALSAQIRKLANALARVISSIEGEATLNVVERLRQLAKSSRGGISDADEQLKEEVAKLDSAQAYEMAMAFTTYFELVNLAEENCRLQILRERQAKYAADPESAPLRESIESAVAELKTRGVSSDEMQAICDKLHLELVLTAHPTESKRRTMLNKLSRLAKMLRRQHAPAEHRFSAQDDLDIDYEINSLWLTDRNRTKRPEVTDEIRTGLWYFDQSLWETLPRLQRDLTAALAKHFPGVTPPKRWLTFGSWIGGDRDGNPNVTTAVTAKALSMHRKVGLSRFTQSAHKLSRQVSVSTRRDRVSPEFTELLEKNQHLSPHFQRLSESYPHQPYRMLLAGLVERCQNETQELPEVLLDPKNETKPLQSAEIKEALDTMISSLEQSRGKALAGGAVADLRQQIETFGLQMARLDVRQHSAWHESAMGELLVSKLDGKNYADLSEQEKVDILTKLLEGEEIAQLREGYGELSEETERVLGPLSVIRRAQDLLGAEAVGIYIISMANALSDVLEVLFFQRWCGLRIPIAPLFETLADLNNAPGILKEMYHHSGYRSHLNSLGEHQYVMLGYSDSNKDCGYLAANWALYGAQEKITATCAEAKVTVTLFHGRGGSIARGGGPAAKAILAQPCGLRDGGIRVTEQGEVLSTRYHDPELAQRILEQMTYGVLLGTYEARKSHALSDTWREAMEEISGAAEGLYRKVVRQDPSFIEFWKQTTPIDMIGNLKFGSRPAFRRKTTSVEDLRAIPWVFSWMQSRFNFPGWFGLGTALETYAEKHGLDLLREMNRDWAFFSTIMDNAQLTLSKADMKIAELYTGLVEDEALRARFFNLIKEENERTQRMILEVTGQNELLENEPVLKNSVLRRNPYIDPLNYIQVEMIRRLRANPDMPVPDQEAIQSVIELTINGVSHGLKNTG